MNHHYVYAMDSFFVKISLPLYMEREYFSFKNEIPSLPFSFSLKIFLLKSIKLHRPLLSSNFEVY